MKCIGRLVNTQQGFYFDFFSDVDQTCRYFPMVAECNQVSVSPRPAELCPNEYSLSCVEQYIVAYRAESINGLSGAVVKRVSNRRAILDRSPVRISVEDVSFSFFFQINSYCMALFRGVLIFAYFVEN